MGDSEYKDKSLDFKDNKIEDKVKEHIWYDRKVIAYSSLIYAFLMTPFYAVLSFYVPTTSFEILIELGIWSVLGAISIVAAYMGFKSYFSKNQ